MRLFHRAVFEKHFVKFCTLAPPVRYFHWSNLCSSFHTDDGRHVYEAEQIPQKTHDKIRINLMNVLKLKKMIIYLLSHTWFCEQITVFDVSYIISTTLEMIITIWTIKWIIHNKWRLDTLWCHRKERSCCPTRPQRNWRFDLDWESWRTAGTLWSTTVRRRRPACRRPTR